MSASAAASAALTTFQTRTVTFDYSKKKSEATTLRAFCSFVLLSGEVSKEVNDARNAMQTIAESLRELASELAQKLKEGDQSLIVESEALRVTCTLNVTQVDGKHSLQPAVEAIARSIEANLPSLFT